MAELTTKELTGLEDILSQEDIIIKKYQTYCNISNDPDIKKKFSFLISNHTRFYNTLLNQLQ